VTSTTETRDRSRQAFNRAHHNAIAHAMMCDLDIRTCDLTFLGTSYTPIGRKDGRCDV